MLKAMASALVGRKSHYIYIYYQWATNQVCQLNGLLDLPPKLHVFVEQSRKKETRSGLKRKKKNSNLPGCTDSSSLEDFYSWWRW